MSSASVSSASLKSTDSDVDTDQDHTRRYLLYYTQQQLRPIIAASILLVIATMADIATPWLMKIFIDDYLIPNNLSLPPLLTLSLLLLGSIVVSAAVGYWQSVRWCAIAHQIVATIRTDLFKHLLKLPIKAFDYTPVGTVISRITNDTETLMGLYATVFAGFVQNGIKLIGVLIAMLFLNWRLCLICLGFIVAVVVIMTIYRKLSTPIFDKARSLLSDINANLSESIQGVKTLQAFQREQRFAERFKTINEDYFVARRKTMQLDALLLRPMVDLLYLLTLAGLTYVFGLDVLNNIIEIGVLYAFVNYLGRFTEPLIEMTQRLNMLQRALVSAKRIFDWMETDIDHPGGTDRINQVNANLALKAVSFRYQADTPLIDNISCELTAGRQFAIVGPTGSGKSTLINLMLRLYQPDTGAIHLANQTLPSIDTEALRQHMAIVQQDTYLFMGTVRDNIDIKRGLPNTLIDQIAEQTGLSETGIALDTELTERGSNLSAGQQQLIAFARALAGSPKILVLDEATANLDSATELRLLKLLEAQSGSMMVITIAHRISTITQADEILVLHQGRLVQQGSHDHLMQQDGLYRHLIEAAKDLND